MTKSTCCSSRGPGFDSQHPHSGPRPSLTPVPGHMTSFPGLHRIQVVCGAQTPMQVKHPYTKTDHLNFLVKRLKN